MMRRIAITAFVMSACLFLSIETGAAQSTSMGCSSENAASGSQILRCEDGVTIVAENGARFTLQDRDGNGRVDSVELSSRALLLEAPKKSSRNRFQVITP